MVSIYVDAYFIKNGKSLKLFLDLFELHDLHRFFNFTQISMKYAGTTSSKEIEKNHISPHMNTGR